MLKDLDATDRTEHAPPHDGRYQGIDLKALATRYIHRYSSHQPSIGNAFAATLGLHRYVTATAPLRGKDDLRMLSTALLEGARACMDEKKTTFNRIPGFSSRFIDAEFDFYFTKEILGRKQAMGTEGWQSYWHGILSDCRTDLFVSQNNCAF
jgi:hypothetical protein